MSLLIDRIGHRVANSSEAAAEDSNQAAPRATVHVILKEGADATLCGKVSRLDTTRMSVMRVVSCAECNAELKKIRQRNSRDGNAAAAERRQREHEQRITEEAEHARREQSELERDAESFRKLRECCGYVENGSEQTVRLFQDDATRSWIVKCGDRQMVSSVPAQYSSARSYHGASLNEAIDMAFVVEKQAD